MRISDWSSDVCSSDLQFLHRRQRHARLLGEQRRVQPPARTAPARGGAEDHDRIIGEARKAHNVPNDEIRLIRSDWTDGGDRALRQPRISLSIPPTSGDWKHVV